VSEDDIANAVPGDPARNPLALAIVRQLNVAQARVGSRSAMLIWNSPNRDVEVARLPLAARMFMVGFRAPVSVRPFTFRLAVTAVQWRSSSTAPSILGLPVRAREAAERITEHAQALLGRSDEFALGSKDLFIVKQTLETYLPEIVAGYLALHEEQRSQPIAADGRTGQQVLMHELALLEAKLEQIRTKLDRTSATRLLVQERFLEDQVGESRSEE
jgi:hypothetical protein